MPTISYYDKDKQDYVEIPTVGPEPEIPSEAKDISYDNSESGLDAANVQEAVDEVYGKRFEPIQLKEGTDLNDVLEPGWYYTLDSGTAMKCFHTPPEMSEVSFSLEVLQSVGKELAGGAVIQRLTEFYTGEFSKIFERHIYLEDNLFGDWFQIYTSVNPDPKIQEVYEKRFEPIALKETDDLNDILDPGWYYIPNGDVSLAIKNSPSDQPASLEVLRSARNPNTALIGIVQRLSEYYRTGRIFERHIYFSGNPATKYVGDWYQVYTSANPDPNIANKVSKDGDKMTGPLVLEKGSIAFNTEGEPGNNGWVKIATITILRQYVNYLIQFEINQRGLDDNYLLNIRFHSVSTNDPSLNIFTYIGDTTPYVCIHKSETSVWDIYIKKTEGWDLINVISVRCPYNAIYTNLFDIAFHNTQVSEPPADAIKPVKGGSVAEADYADYSNTLYLPRQQDTNANDLAKVNRVTLVEAFGSSSQNLPSNRWYHLLSLMGNDVDFATQLALQMTSGLGLYYRSKQSKVWLDWIKILTSIDYGTTDISGIGDGTISGAIKKLSESAGGSVDYLYSITFTCPNNPDYTLTVWYDDDICLTSPSLKPGERIQYIQRLDHKLNFYIATGKNDGGSAYIGVFSYDKNGMGQGEQKLYNKDSYGQYAIKDINPFNIRITI